MFSCSRLFLAYAADVPASCEHNGLIHGGLPSPLTAWVIVKDPAGGSDREAADKRTAYLIPEQPNRAKGMSKLCVMSNDTIHPYKTRITVAIYADGQAFGDRAQIANFEAERAKEEKQYLHVETRLCELAKQGMNLDQILAALDGEHVSSPALDELHHNYRHPMRTPRDTAAWIQGNLKVLSQKRTDMLDPVRDEHGKLYIGDAEPNPVCALP